ncbi:MAG TPA: UDP-glucose 4-epimerase GalE [Candidatus Acidoferrales bacterium]|jgi:UDP-glucose 4-epimerase|nr:UDP-glucose 4-epimerase GalE [Candidatus Acidoferrales bacterium]HWF13316.1 UDP-glucose 4-epimerase GalE [Candidatus Acidoferrales bacterium]
MAILVTGGSGYIGSVTVECLLAKGEEVVVLDDLAHGHRAALPANIPFYQGKIGDGDLVSRIAREHKLDSCIHFAAMIEVGESVVDPAKYFENNVAQGIAFAGHLLSAGVKCLVFSSTAATYGDPEEIPITEQSRKWPRNPYGWSKLFMERLFDSYDTAYGLKFVALRYFNAAGATETRGEDHQPESHLIPNVLKAALGHQKAIRVYGNNYPTPDGTPIRDYIHVVDLANAHIRALEYLRAGGSSDYFNLGTGRGYSVLEVIECARQVTGRDIPVQIESPRAGDPARLIADPTKAKSVLGWEAVASDLRSIVLSAWDWRTRHPGGYGESRPAH